MFNRSGEPGTRSLLFLGIVAVIVLAIATTITTIVTSKDHVLETQIEETQATERAEESAQFWQKLVPWGDYEDETAD